MSHAGRPADCLNIGPLDRPRRSGVTSDPLSLPVTKDRGGSMGSAKDSASDPNRASSLACPAQRTCPPAHLASAVVSPNRHPPSRGGGLRHPDHSGIARAQRRQGDHGLRPCFESGREGHPEPLGFSVSLARGVFCGNHGKIPTGLMLFTTRHCCSVALRHVPGKSIAQLS